MLQHKEQQVTVLPNFIETEKDKENEKTEEFSQLKEQEKTPEKIINEIKVNKLPNEEFKALVIRILTELGKRIDENFNKELKNVKRRTSQNQRIQ